MSRLYHKHGLFFQLLLLLIIAAILIYYIPSSVNRFLFLLLLIPVWRTKNDFFWFAFILILLEQPGGLFSGGTVDDPYRLPIYNLATGISFSFEELYILLILVKPLFKKQLFFFRAFAYRKQFQILVLLLIALLIVSFALGMSLDSMRNTYKNLLKLSLYFSAIFVFRKEEDIIGFFKVLFPFVFLAILLQLYGITYNQQIIALFKPRVNLTQGVLTGELMRSIELSVVLLIGLFGSFLFLGIRNSPFSRNYLILINITALISIMMTATRSWFLGFTMMYLFYFILNYQKSVKNIVNTSLGLVFFLSVLFFIPQVNSQVKKAFARIETIKELVEGDLTAGGTLSRLTERGPRVMEGFKNSTIIFGAGFSDLYYDYGDGHVGFHNMLLNSGIVGLILLIVFAFKLFFKPYQLSKRINDPRLKHILRNIPLLIPTLLLITSSTQFWGYSIWEISRVIMISFYISLSGFYLREGFYQCYSLQNHLTNHK